jgi:hypothetical protein
LTDRIRINQRLSFQRPEPLLSFRATARRGVQRRIHFTNRYDISGYLFLRRGYQAASLIDAIG